MKIIRRSNTPHIVNMAVSYLKVNWGAPFIVTFMCLLVTAATSLSFGLSSLAESVAIYAFYALVGGIILQFTCYLKYPKTSTEESA